MDKLRKSTKTARAAKKQPPPTLAQRITAAIAEAQENGWTINRIALASGVPQPSLALWYAGERESLNHHHMNTLQHFFGISVGPARKNLKPPKAKP